MTLTDIDMAYELAKLGADTSSQSIENETSDVDTFNSTIIFVNYRLKSGRDVIRQYYINDSDLLDMANEIYSMREYKEGSYPIYNMKSLPTITCSKDYKNSDNLTLTKEENKYLLSTYQDEFGALSLYDIKEMEPIADITFNTEYSSYTYFIYPTFTKTITFLKEHGFDCETPVDTSKIDSISLSYYKNPDNGVEEDKYYKEQSIATGEQTVNITKQDQIDEIFPLLVKENYVWNNQMLVNYDTELYVSVTFKLDDYGNTSTVSYYFKKAEIPSFVKTLVGYRE
jgi:ABC-2 type transport system permease protein